MEMDLEKKGPHNIERVPDQRFRDVRAFVDKVVKENEGMVASVVLKRPSVSGERLDLMFVLDDLNSVIFDPQVREFTVAASEMAYGSTLPLHCDAVLASVFWEGFLSRDVDTLQMAREGLVVHDNGFFLPVQDLLVSGKVRPSKESMNVYFVKAERSMKTSNQKVGRAIIDLYWAVTDAAHAAVMVAGITPPSPKHLAEAVRRELVARNLIHKRCAEIVGRFYDSAKRIMHREVFEISGREFDSHLDDADFFLKEIRDFVREHVDKEVNG